MTHLLGLLAGLGCVLLLDHRFRLFFWRDPITAAIVTAAGTVFFLLWDATGIAAGIFLRGDSPWATGIVLAPELPLEEPVFLVLLSTCTMVAYTGFVRIVGTARLRGIRRDRSEDLG
ncbi:lycopene cyclase domain-containing protein [Microbacterium soli]